MNTIRFSILSLLILVGSALSMACGYADAEIRYYIFYLPSENECYHERINRQLAEEWSRLIGIEVSPEDVSGLTWSTYGDLEDSENPIIKRCVSRNLTEEKQYLRLLLKLIKESSFSYDSWDYPSKEDIANHNRNMRAIGSEAARYNGTRLANQYLLTRMRVAFALQDWDSLRSLYTSKPAKGVFADMIDDLYAGMLYRTGHKEEAFAIYSRLGDNESAKWCAAKTGSVDGIRTFYEADPNSPVVPWLIKEFCDNVQETCDQYEYFLKLDKSYTQGQSFDEYSKDTFDMLGARKISESDVDDFGVLVGSAVVNPSVQDKKMWLSALTLCYYYLGNQQKAGQLLARASTAPGTSASQTGLGYIKMFVDLASRTDAHDRLNSCESYLPTMMAAGKTDPHADRMMQRLVDFELIPALRATGENVKLIALSAIMSRDYDPEIIRGDWDVNPRYSTPYFQCLDTVPVADIIQYKNYMASPDDGKNRLLTMARQSISYPEEYLNDIIGTRLIRAGRFRDAIPYLETLSSDFLMTQNISPYAATRKYTIAPWIGWRSKVDNQHFKRLAVNPKLDYCRRVVSASERLAATPGSRDACYDLAALYAQAGRLNPCWWLAWYSTTSCEPYDDSEFDVAATDMDFDRKAVELLRKGLELKGGTHPDVELYFAIAYCTPGLYKNFDWDKGRYVIMPNAPKTEAYRDAIKAMRTGTATTPCYITRCDNLRLF